MATAKDALVERAAAAGPSAMTLQDYLTAQTGRIAQALPRHMTPERLLAVVMHSVRTTRHLAECTPGSLIACVMDCATLGLEPGPLGRAYLVPRLNRRRTPPVYEATLIIGYRGLVELARRSGELSTVSAHEVYAGDDFTAEYGLDPILRHRPRWADRTGEPVLYYAVARLADGQHHFDVMTASEIDAIRRRSATPDDGPWATDPIEMGKKTVLRRLMKLLPMAAEVAEAIERADDASEDLTPHLAAIEESLKLAATATLPAAGGRAAEAPAPAAKPRKARASSAEPPPADPPPPPTEAPPAAPAPAPAPSSGPTLRELTGRLEAAGWDAARITSEVKSVVGNLPSTQWTREDTGRVRRHLASLVDGLGAQS